MLDASLTPRRLMIREPVLSIEGTMGERPLPARSPPIAIRPPTASLGPLVDSLASLLSRSFAWTSRVGIVSRVGHPAEIRAAEPLVGNGGHRRSAARGGGSQQKKEGASFAPSYQQ